MTVRSGMDSIVGGYDTARVSAADNDQQRRVERAAAAVAWMTRHGVRRSAAGPRSGARTGLLSALRPGPRDRGRVLQAVRLPGRDAGGGPMTALYEQLAAIEHDRWCDWQRYLHSLCERREDGALVIPADRVKHWERQISTPYAALSEHEKDMDREQVARYWDLVANGGAR